MGSLKGDAKAVLGAGRPQPLRRGGQGCAAGAHGPAGPTAGTIVLLTGEDHRFNDLVVSAAKRRFMGELGLVFPLKVATRMAQPEADVLAVSRQAFAEMAADGCFLAEWSGDGRQYGLPAACRDALETGRTIVVAASREAVRVLADKGLPVAVIEVAGVTGRRLTRLPSARPGDGVHGARVLARVVHGGNGAEAVKAVIEVLARLTVSGRPSLHEATAAVAPPERPVESPSTKTLRSGRGTRRRTAPARVVAVPVA